VNAKKEVLGKDKALALLDGIVELHVTKGKKVVHLNLKKERYEDDELAKFMLGPTGNLRAPTLRKGRILVIGFNDDIYTEVFG
jgi:arsenate reductase-like glutaredoxin family protein